MTTATLADSGPVPAVIDRPELARHIAVLDGLRALAILPVLVFHFCVKLQNQRGFVSIFPILRAGTAGVDLFFVISGFLITGILLDTQDQPHYFRNFYARRTLRIFPLYYGTLAMVFLVLPMLGVSIAPQQASHQGWLWLYLTNIGMTCRGIDFGPVSHFWSLGVEEQFYLIWPLLVLLAGKRRTVIVCICLLAMFSALRIWLLLSHNLFMLGTRLPSTRADGLPVGAMLAVLARSDVGFARLARLSRHSIPFLITALVMVILLERGPVGGWMQVVKPVMVSILCGGLLLTAIQPAGARWPALLHARSLRLIGKYSYGIYVIHNLLMPWFYDHFLRKSWLIRPVPGIAATLIYLVLSFLCSLAAAYISWHLFEKKFLSLKRFFPSREQTLTTGITGNRTLTNF